MHDLMGSTVAGPRHHAVQFYGSEASLFATVADFLGSGLVAGQPAVLIAAAAHRDGIIGELAERSIDLTAARRKGNLLVLDAESLLPLVLSRGEPDAALFDHHLGGIIEESLGGRRDVVVRIYGELVDLLWKDGKADAAVKLEVLWNRLAGRYGFALLCGYAMGQLSGRPGDLDEIRAQHSHVFRDTDAVRR